MLRAHERRENWLAASSRGGPATSCRGTLRRHPAPTAKGGAGPRLGVAGTQDVSLTLGPELQTDRWKGFQGLGGAESHRWGVAFEALGVASERSALHGDLGTRAEGTAGGPRMRWAQRRRVRWRRPHRGGGRGSQAPPPRAPAPCGPGA